MRRLIFGVFTVAVIMLMGHGTGFAHVPYFEYGDFSESNPFLVQKGIEQSIAVYAWFNTGDDLDVYQFQVVDPVRVFVQSLVPVCLEYENLLPSFAVVGPDLLPPEVDLPFELPPGYGAIVVQNLEPGEPRETFYEPFGGKWYYDGPSFDDYVFTSGTWYIYFWDPHGTGGDYVGVLGYEEQWDRSDIIRGLFYTPLIRRDKELHVECAQYP